MPKAILLPAVFAVIVVPIAWFVSSGAGTHMSALLLYPPASPWWMFFPVNTAEEELRVLQIGCTINLVLLGLLGIAWDQYARRRAHRAGTGAS
jgi:hypothetical protein